MGSHVKWAIAPMISCLLVANLAGAQENQAQSADAALSQRLRVIEEQMAEIQQAREDEELQNLRQAAETSAATAGGEAEVLEERTYITASRSLQALNPEISLSGDFLAQFIMSDELRGYASANDRSSMPLRALDLHIQSTLDPFSFTKMALGYIPGEGVDIEELYITWAGIIPRSTLTVGRFRQSFGVLNRWHEHDLDQTGYPMVIEEILGGGLTGNGVSLGWLMPPLLAHTNHLTIEIADGDNEELFAGEAFSVPTVMAHLKNFYDLSDDTYLELGFSGLYGFNNRRGFEDPAAPGTLLSEDDWRPTWVVGADLTLNWSPLRQARYRSFLWRSEGMWASKEIDSGTEQGWGLYSYIQYQMSAAWFTGLRADLVRPIGDDGDPLLWQLVAYLTFWQSEFVYLRLEAQHGELADLGHDTRILFQINWAAGPHKHEKY